MPHNATVGLDRSQEVDHGVGSEVVVIGTTFVDTNDRFFGRHLALAIDRR
jgi:hypothetical protein